MSTKLVQWVFDHSQTVGTERAVALYLAWSIRHDEGVGWPRIALVAEKAKTSRRTVQRTIAHMVELGELTVTHRPRNSSLYQFTYGATDVTQTRVTDVTHGRHLRPVRVTNTTRLGDTHGAPIGKDRERKGKDRERAHARVPPSSSASHSLPDSEKLTPAREAMAKNLGLGSAAIPHQWQRLRDHEFPSPHADWDKVWRNWCRRAVEFQRDAVKEYHRAVPDAAATRRMLRDRGL